jgi:hypothetical protein
MKLVRLNDGGTGLVAQTPMGPRVVDVVASLSVLAPADLTSQGVLKRLLKNRGNWGRLIEHWPIAREGLRRIANLATVGAPGIAYRHTEDIRTSANQSELGDVASLEVSEWGPWTAPQDPTGYNLMVGQFTAAASAASTTDGEVISLDDHRTPHWWL